MKIVWPIKFLFFVCICASVQSIFCMEQEQAQPAPSELIANLPRDLQDLVLQKRCADCSPSVQPVRFSIVRTGQPGHYVENVAENPSRFMTLLEFKRKVSVQRTLKCAKNMQDMAARWGEKGIWLELHPDDFGRMYGDDAQKYKKMFSFLRNLGKSSFAPYVRGLRFVWYNNYGSRQNWVFNHIGSCVTCFNNLCYCDVKSVPFFYGGASISLYRSICNPSLFGLRYYPWIAGSVDTTPEQYKAEVVSITEENERLDDAAKAQIVTDTKQVFTGVWNHRIAIAQVALCYVIHEAVRLGSYMAIDTLLFGRKAVFTSSYFKRYCWQHFSKLFAGREYNRQLIEASKAARLSKNYVLYQKTQLKMVPMIFHLLYVEGPRFLVTTGVSTAAWYQLLFNGLGPMMPGERLVLKSGLIGYYAWKIIPRVIERIAGRRVPPFGFERHWMFW
ncbi:MAG: hypothetical protein UU47_C0009G0025 [candidate division TM6 bacterium GW2011_GWE2_41_16]|nr:MAG: hypothetical protein UU47_C0009G0025 [candidate division TM6 bacterium GW2011_GWE2_41_16]